MTVYTASTAGAGKQAKSSGFAGQKLTATGSVILADTRGTTVVTSGPLSGDVYRLVKLPAGAIVVGGRFFGSRIASGTSAASTTMQLNIGFSGAFKDTIDGTSYGGTTASQALGAAVPQDYSEASVGGIKSESGANFALGGLLYTLGPLRLTEDQWAQVAFVGSATSFISGSQMTLQIDYYMGQHV